ncbi:MAG: ABC transporter substrate-binding protein [Gemmatimonadetes bacterium]|jgi:NitT/TauT family transport system substrate-binding protein|nr:ABC transporter substrate-binding protein [Gemmatimonadota bacterium]MBT6148296.1 ABC transporter substrate-binding protein [Gemmatimonadota bacterium]MBT7860055.1 ABC transporter substrate-binding protein [Gemmatimonadota bacterium]
MPTQESPLRPTVRSTVLLLLLGFTILACGTPEPADRPLQLALNWFPEAEHGGYYAAAVHGDYQLAGIDVEILGGGPDAPVIQRVATGQVDFGLTNADGVITARAAGAPIVAVFAPYQINPRCILVHEESGIKQIQDLENLTLALSQRPAFSHYLRHRFDFPGVTIVPYHGSVIPFIDDIRYAMQGYVFSEPIVAQRLGASPRSLLVSETGFNPYASVLITTEEKIRTEPATVAAIVAAAQTGWTRYLESATATNEHINGLNPGMDVEILEIGARLSRDLVLTGDAFHPAQIGVMSLERWQQLIDQMVEAGIVEAGEVEAEGCFTTGYLPSGGASATPE